MPAFLGLTRFFVSCPARKKKSRSVGTQTNNQQDLPPPLLLHAANPFEPIAGAINSGWTEFMDEHQGQTLGPREHWVFPVDRLETRIRLARVSPANFQEQFNKSFLISPQVALNFRLQFELQRANTGYELFIVPPGTIQPIIMGRRRAVKIWMYPRAIRNNPVDFSCRCWVPDLTWNQQMDLKESLGGKNNEI